MRNEKKNGRIFLLMLLALMFIETSMFGATYTATTGTGILQEVAQTEISGALGFVIILIAIVLAGITLIQTKNAVVAGIVLVGGIFIAMSPDLAAGIINQFGYK